MAYVFGSYAINIFVHPANVQFRGHLTHATRNLAGSCRPAALMQEACRGSCKPTCTLDGRSHVAQLE